MDFFSSSRETSLGPYLEHKSHKIIKAKLLKLKRRIEEEGKTFLENEKEKYSKLVMYLSISSKYYERQKL